MTTSTTNLSLITYDTITDGSSLVNSYLTDMSSSAISNMTKIDAFAGNTSSSLTDISGSLTNISSACQVLLDSSSFVPNGRILTAGEGISITNSSASIVTIGAISASGAPISACYVVLELNSGLSDEKVLLSGNGTNITIDTGASSISIDLAYADANQASSGSSATAVISASALSQSNYGVKTALIPLNEGTALAGGETRCIRIPQYMNGWKLIDATASCGAPNGSGSSTSGSPSFNILRSSASSMSQVGMLTNLITIDESEFDSSTSASPVVISAANTVYTGDKVWAITSASGTGVKYAQVSPTFRNMP